MKTTPWKRPASFWPDNAIATAWFHWRACGLTLSMLLAVADGESATLRYVDASSASPSPPYTSWATAARMIQDAVDAAAAGDEIVVTNGTYAIGGRAAGTNVLVNRVTVEIPLRVRSVNGPQVTVIRGLKVVGGFLGCGDGAIRCVSLADGASLSGFTLTNGATRFDGDPRLEQSGGGVWCESQATVVSNCVLTGNGAWFGGGAFGGTLIDCTVTNNSARTNGGGAFTSTLFDCALTRNSSRFGDGGGAYLCNLYRCMLASNVALNAWGGGASESALDYCTLVGNTATWGGGGAYGGALNHCNLTNNSAELGGGAFSAALTNCSLSGNSAGAAGGAYASTLSNCTLVGNRATATNNWTGGGGAAGSLLFNCLLDHNSSAWYGGGVSGVYSMVEGAPPTVLCNCVLTGNSAQLGGGAYGGNLYNCTLTGNSAGTGGGMVGSSLWNCILYFNSATSSPNFAESPYRSPNWCCTWPMPTNGVGNITNAPLFVDYASGNLRLQSNSPCINSGNNSSLTNRVYDEMNHRHVWLTNLFDLDSNPRIVRGTVDIGAYEYQGPGSLISYAWLQRYGLPTDGSEDLADPDADGHNIWQEWRCQTDPTNALSVLRLLSASPLGTDVTVTWQSVAGVSYLLERSTNLPAIPMFSPVAANLPGQSGITTYRDTNAATGSPLFYRIGVP